MIWRRRSNRKVASTIARSIPLRKTARSWKYKKIGKDQSLRITTPCHPKQDRHSIKVNKWSWNLTQTDVQSPRLIFMTRTGEQLPPRRNQETVRFRQGLQNGRWQDRQIDAEEAGWSTPKDERIDAERRTDSTPRNSVGIRWGLQNRNRRQFIFTFRIKVWLSKRART